MGSESNYVIAMIFFFIFIIGDIVYNFIMLFQISPSDVYYAKVIGDRWKQYPIQNISLTKKEGYEELVFFYLKGLKKGCDCYNTSQYGGFYEGKKCNYYQKNAGCIEITDDGGKGSKIYNSIFYVSYYKENYLSLLSRNDFINGYCKYGYKRCGVLDNKNNQFCIKDEEEECPINYISFFINRNGTLDFTSDNNNKNLTIINKVVLSEFTRPTIEHIYKNELVLLDSDVVKKFKNGSDRFRENYLSQTSYERFRKKRVLTENNLLQGSSYLSDKDLFIFKEYYHGLPKRKDISFTEITFMSFWMIIILFILRIVLIVFLIIFIFRKKEDIKKNRILYISCVMFLILSFIFLNIFKKIPYFYGYQYDIYFSISIIADYITFIYGIVLKIYINKNKDENYNYNDYKLNK